MQLRLAGKTRPITVPARRSRLMRGEQIAGNLFALPWILGFFLFTAGPMLYSVILIFLEWDILQPPRWAGLNNFRRLLGDELFSLTLWNTAYYTFLSVPLQLIVALAIALLLNMRIRGVSVYRTIYYMPSIVPAVASTMLWLWIFHPDYGLANMVMRWLNLSPQLWFHDPKLVKAVFVLISLWSAGNVMIIFLAGLQSVPETLLEAAQIDGAGTWARFRHVTLPMLSPTIFFNLVMGLIGSFQVFTSAYIATNGGPGYASLFYVLYLYRNGFQYYRMGYASLLAWVLFVLIVGLTYLQFRLGSRWVYYEGR